jgi:hypothetical protein
MGLPAAAESSNTSQELQDPSTPVSIAMEMGALYHVERFTAII